LRGGGVVDVSSPTATVAAGVLGLVGVLLSTWANVRIRRTDIRAAREVESLRLALTEAKEIRAEGRSKRVAAETTISRYREPLLGAAFDLQGRIFNISRGGFFYSDTSSYHIDHTLYVFGQYLGWREIIRQEIQFMDLGDTPATRALAEQLERITHSLSSSRRELSDEFKIFRGEQRAMGEKMMISGAGDQYRCLGYTEFVEALSRAEFAIWFEKLRSFVEGLRTSRNADFSRLSLLQNALLDLIDGLDPDALRFPAHLRKRMPMPHEVAELYAPQR
jgi:hypothetical protein